MGWGGVGWGGTGPSPAKRGGTGRGELGLYCATAGGGWGGVEPHPARVSGQLETGGEGEQAAFASRVGNSPSLRQGQVSTLKLLSPLPAAAIVEPPKLPPPSPQHRQLSRQGWRWQRREAPARPPPPLPPGRRRRRRQIRELPQGKTSPAERQLSATPPPPPPPPPSQPGAHNCTGVWIPLGFFSTAFPLAPPHPSLPLFQLVPRSGSWCPPIGDPCARRTPPPSLVALHHGPPSGEEEKMAKGEGQKARDVKTNVLIRWGLKL